MKFKRIRMKNIRSYKEQEITFPDGSLLLAGDVGSGKTTVLLAIEYALIGLQPGQKGSSLLRNNSPSGEVDLEIEMQGRKIIIERKLKRASKGVVNDYAAITVDGEKLETSITELKSKIVSMLGYTPEFIKKNNILYRYTIYTPQEQMKQIISEDPATRLDILRHVFGIDKFKKIRENLSIFLLHLKGETKLIQGEIMSLEEDKENMKKRKSSLKILEEKLKLKQDELQEKTEKRKQVESQLQEIEKKIDERKIFEREVEKTKIMLQTKKESLSSLKSELEETIKSLDDERDKFSEKEYFLIQESIKNKKSSVESISTRHSELVTRLNFLEKEKRETSEKKERIFRIEICPTCLQDVPESHKHNILNETESRLSGIKREIESMSGEKSLLMENFILQKAELQKLEDSKIKMEILKSKQDYLKKSREKLSHLQKQEQTIIDDISLLAKHIENLKESILKYSVYENQLSRKREELRRETFEERNHEIEVAGLKKEIELSGNEILLLEIAIQKKEESKLKLQNLQELMDWLSTQFTNLVEFAERNVLIKLRKEFSTLFRKWFILLIPENSLDSQVDENFTPIIMQGEAEMDYDFLSGGERTAVALAYRLALNQTVNSVLSKIKTRGIIILDEPTDGFSEQQIGKIRDIFEELNAEQLIIVSHEQKIEGFVDNVVRITKQGSTSLLENANQTSSDYNGEVKIKDNNIASLA